MYKLTQDTEQDFTIHEVGYKHNATAFRMTNNLSFLHNNTFLKGNSWWKWHGEIYTWHIDNRINFLHIDPLLQTFSGR